MAARIHLGTVGWINDDWTGPFYPPGTPAARRLEIYSRVFSTVEIDTTFYGIPRTSTLDGWAAATPADFRFSAKVPKAITHDRRLIDSEEAAAFFADLMHKHLGEKLGNLLLQLRPDFGIEECGRLRNLLEYLTGPRSPKGAFRWAVEFRNRSAVDDETLAFLQERGVVCVVTERLDPGISPRYVRLLGTEGAFNRFDERQVDRTPELQGWANRLLAAAAETEEPIYIYCRNLFEGHSPATLAVLARLLGQTLPTPTGRQQMSLFD